MDIKIERRAEIALRSLGASERKQALNSINKLAGSPSDRFLSGLEFQKIRTESGEELFIHRAGRRMRLVLSRDSSGWILEDIVDHDRLETLLHSPG